MANQRSKMHPMDATTTIIGTNCFLSTHEIGAIEGWIQFSEVAEKKSYRIITLTLIDHKKDIDGALMQDINAPKEFFVEFVDGYIQWGVTDNIFSVQAKDIGDGQQHQFCINMHMIDGNYSLIIDGKELPKPKGLNGALSTDYLIDSVTIGNCNETKGFKGGIADLHFWRTNLSIDQLNSLSDWDNGHYCPTMEFLFTAIPASALIGFLNPNINAFLFYYEPQGCWVMEGSEPPSPIQDDVKGIDPTYHTVYKTPRYFLAAREKETGTLYIINDKGETPLSIRPVETESCCFISDDLKFQFDLDSLNPTATRQLISLELLHPDKSIPDIFKSSDPKDKSLPRLLQLLRRKENTGVEQIWGSSFPHKMSGYAFNQFGWNVVNLPNPFDISELGGNKIFIDPGTKSKSFSYDGDDRNMAVPYGFKYKKTSFGSGKWFNSLVKNGTDLRQATTHSKSISANRGLSCELFSIENSFEYNEKLSNTQEDMYKYSYMFSEHTYFATTHTIILDKSNVTLSSDDTSVNGLGFLSYLEQYENHKILFDKIFNLFGTHYANAIRYGARGRARKTYTQLEMANYLQNCKSVGWGVQAKVSGTYDGITGSLGGGYNTEDAKEDSNKISFESENQDENFECIGGNCHPDATVDSIEPNAIPIFIDLRQITELLAPPFFDTYEKTVTLRNRLQKDLNDYLASNLQKNNNKEVFGFYSLAITKDTCKNVVQFYDIDKMVTDDVKDFFYKYPSKVMIKITNLSSVDSDNKNIKDMTLEINYPDSKTPIDPKATIASNFLDSIQGSGKIQIELIPPAIRPLPDDKYKDYHFKPIPDERFSKLKLIVDLDISEKDLSSKGLKLEFQLAGRVQLTNEVKAPDSGRIIPGPFHKTLLFTFPVLLKRLDIQEIFYNGLPEELKRK